MFVDAEDLLNHDHAALGLTCGVGAIRAQLMTVICRQRELLTQLDLLFSAETYCDARRTGCVGLPQPA
jgi:hypothetical protein